MSTHNFYQCPNCFDDVAVALPPAKYANCRSCGAKLEIHPATEQEQDDNGDWHIRDATELSIVDDEREHMKRMLDFGLANRREEGCSYCEEHKNDHMMPPHTASIHCESGKHPHCTCDICY